MYVDDMNSRATNCFTAFAALLIHNAIVSVNGQCTITSSEYEDQLLLTEMQQQQQQNAQAFGHLNKQIQSMRGFLETSFQQLRRSLDVRPQNYGVDIKHQNWNAGDVRNGKTEHNEKSLEEM